MIIEFLTAGLLIVTAYYVWQTHKILKEQRKTAELSIIPSIVFDFNDNPSLAPLNVKIYCQIRENSLYNLNMKVFINNEFKGENDLGNAIIPINLPFGNSDPFDITEFLSNIEKEKEFTIGIKIFYELRSGSKLAEKYEWNAHIAPNNELKIRKNYPKTREIISAPWL